MKKIYYLLFFLFVNVVNFSEGYEVSWDSIAENINKEIETGLTKIIDPILIILALLTVIKIITMILKYSTGIYKDINKFCNVLIYYKKQCLNNKYVF